MSQFRGRKYVNNQFEKIDSDPVDYGDLWESIKKIYQLVFI